MFVLKRPFIIILCKFFLIVNEMKIPAQKIDLLIKFLFNLLIYFIKKKIDFDYNFLSAQFLICFILFSLFIFWCCFFALKLTRTKLNKTKQTKKPTSTIQVNIINNNWNSYNCHHRLLRHPFKRRRVPTTPPEYLGTTHACHYLITTLMLMIIKTTIILS